MRDRVALRYVWRVIGRGPESNVEATCVFTVRKGEVLQIEYFSDHAEALDAMGLSG